MRERIYKRDALGLAHLCFAIQWFDRVKVSKHDRSAIYKGRERRFSRGFLRGRYK
jgi:hypothetical protein